MAVQWKSTNAADLLLIPEGHTPASNALHRFQAVQQSPSRHVPISGAFITAAIFGHALQVAVQHGQPPGKKLPQQGIIPDHRQGGHKYAGKYPRGPVVEVLADHTHPVKIVSIKERRKYTLVQFPQHAPPDYRRNVIQFFFHHANNKCQGTRCLRGKQIYIRILFFRQGALLRRRLSRMATAVMGADTPEGFLADAP